MRHLPLLLIALLATLLLAGCGGDDGTAGDTGTAPPRDAELVLDWFVNANHAGIVGAQEQGFFTARGLKVTTTVPTDPAAALKQVASGKSEFAVSYAPEVLLARQAGVPVVAVGTLIGVPLNSVIARADRGITRPRDLEGKTVGAAGVPSDRALLDTVVRADGGDPAKVRVRNIGFTLSPALAAGRVDAVIGAYWNIEAPELERQNVPITVMRLEEHGVPSYDELVVVTGDELARDRPDLVRDMLAALAEGQEWAAANPEAAVEALTAANPDLSTAVLGEQVAATVPLFVPEGRRPIAIRPSEWQAFAAWMNLRELFPAGPRADLTEAVSDEFLPGD
jgi:putative hydroxymethylpyrimidine transport system substrate-binding protein